MAKKTKCLLGIAGSMLAAGSLCAADYTEPFESASTWTGGTLTPTDYTYSPSPNVGKPLPDAGHTKVLVVEGDASYEPTLNAFSGSPLVDMMVQAALPDDALETPEGEAHIAVAVDTNGIFNVYCKNKSGDADWYPLSTTAYANGAWARVSLLFDYEHGRCQVRLDGQPMMTANGYLDATTADTTKNGAWYALATNTTSSTAVSNLKVVGCTAIDDVVIAESGATYEYATAGATTSDGVSCAWLDKYGLAWNTAASYDNSKKADGTTAMTVADKYKYCFEPRDGQGEADFAVKSISTTTEKVTLALPSTVANDSRKVVVEYGSDKTFQTSTTTTNVTGTSSVQINVPAPGGVTYYRLRAMDK